MRFLIKGSVAGGAVYLVYDQELLGSSDKSQAVLQKAEEVVPNAVYQFSLYVCEQTGLKLPQLPAPPKFNFHIRDSWNSGRRWSICRQGRGPRDPRGRSPRLASSCCSSTSLDDDEVVILSGAAWEDLEDWWLAVSREIQVQAFEAHPWHLAHEATHLTIT